MSCEVVLKASCVLKTLFESAMERKNIQAGLVYDIKFHSRYLASVLVRISSMPLQMLVSVVVTLIRFWCICVKIITWPIFSVAHSNTRSRTYTAHANIEQKKKKEKKISTLMLELLNTLFSLNRPFSLDASIHYVNIVRKSPKYTTITNIFLQK